MESIVRMVAYHNVYSKVPLTKKTVAKYVVKYREATHTGVNIGNVFETVSTNTRLTYIANLQQQHPKFLHSLFRYIIISRY